MNLAMKTKLHAALAFGLLLGSPSLNAASYAIDFDSTRLSSSNTSGTIDTETGFTSLDVTNGGSATVTIDTIDFSLFTTAPNASRIRNGPNALTRDFIYEEGVANNAVGLKFGGAGDLVAGTWRVEVWAWDSNVAASLDSLIIGTREGISETIHTTTFAGSATDPFVATFVSDGTSAYDVFVRENNDTNRARMNAVRLTLIPEPSTVLLVALGVPVMLRRRR